MTLLFTAPFLSSDARAQESAGELDGESVLRGVREAQASVRQTLQGKLRRGSRTVPFRMVMNGPEVRFEFPNASGEDPQFVFLQLGARDASLRVQGVGGKPLAVRAGEEVYGMGVSYEDLALHFLYWNSAQIEGEERVMMAKCAKIRVRRPQGSLSPYKEVLVWVSPSNGAFLKSEAYGNDGALVRRLTVRSLQSVGQVTTLKQLRVESPSAGGEPTYLDVEGDPVAVLPRR